MIPLGSNAPHVTSTLRAALASGLAPLGVNDAAVSIEGEYPSLAALRLNLTGAKFTRGLKAPKKGKGETQAAFFSRSAAIIAEPATVEGLPVYLKMNAEDVTFAYVRTETDEWALTIDKAVKGEGELRIAVADIETVLRSAAGAAAGKQGGEVESVKMQLTSKGPRALALAANVGAKAMFLTAKVAITGGVEITDSLEAKLHGLNCHGEGMLGNMAAGLLRPQFAKFEGRTFPLATLVPGLKDATVDTAGGWLIIRASVGAGK